jgi:hypothetical protein
MERMAHKVFILFLVLTACISVLAIGVKGFTFYLTPVHLRPFLPEYERMKTSGVYSHGLGVIGASMITLGVITYSTRKRTRALWKFGRLSVWLEFHIFLCLLGPILVIFHTTFKSGGVAAISLWAMISVWASGMVGRFLYAQIPHNMQGAELSKEQIQQEVDRHGRLLAGSPIGQQILRSIDSGFAGVKSPERLAEVLPAMLRLRALRKQINRTLGTITVRSAISLKQAGEIRREALARTALMQQSIILGQVGKLFYYWHAIHLPFTVIMFITLAAHVVVAVLLGYTWIF